eukprot:SAG22_NODE_1556_length_4131_cov_3.350942_2_plen_68_part_00
MPSPAFLLSPVGDAPASPQECVSDEHGQHSELMITVQTERRQQAEEHKEEVEAWKEKVRQVSAALPA